MRWPVPGLTQVSCALTQASCSWGSRTPPVCNLRREREGERERERGGGGEGGGEERERQRERERACLCVCVLASAVFACVRWGGHGLASVNNKVHSAL
jgi:hypothetical protein